MRPESAPVPPIAVDLLLGAVLTAALSVVITSGQGGEREPDAAAYLFAAAVGGLTVARRQSPRTVLVVSVASVFVYYALGYPAIGVALPVAPALFGAADAGLVRWAVAAGAVVLGGSTLARVLEGESLAYLLGYEAVSTLALMTTCVALGAMVRARNQRADEQVQVERLTELFHAEQADRRVGAEREATARDLHDAVGHALAVVSLHAGVASDALGRDHAEARLAIDRVRAATTAAMHDLRATVRVLRGAPEERGDPHPEGSSPIPVSLAGVPSLLGRAAASGLDVVHSVDIDDTDVPAGADAVAFRVIQESLTNVVRHARARRVEVTASVVDHTLSIRVADDGVGPTDDDDAAYGAGLTGMGERVRAVGGTLRTGRTASGGFVVDAILPLGAAAPSRIVR